MAKSTSFALGGEIKIGATGPAPANAENSGDASKRRAEKIRRRARRVSLQDRKDVASVRAALRGDGETFPDALVAAIIEGMHPIKAFREYRGQTQAQLATKVGTSAIYISQLERGDRRASRKLRTKIGAALRVDATLLDGRDA